MGRKIFNQLSIASGYCRLHLKMENRFKLIDLVFNYIPKRFKLIDLVFNYIPKRPCLLSAFIAMYLFFSYCVITIMIYVLNVHMCMCLYFLRQYFFVQRSPRVNLIFTKVVKELSYAIPWG